MSDPNEHTFRSPDGELHCRCGLPALERRVALSTPPPSLPRGMDGDMDADEWKRAYYAFADIAQRQVDRLHAIVTRTAAMGSCSQTHHEHLSADARAALEGAPDE